MGKYFGTDGFRGEANINLTVEHAYKVGRYIDGILTRSQAAEQRSSSVRIQEEVAICLRML